MNITTPAVRRGEVTLTLADMLRRDLRRGRLLPHLRRAATEAFLLDQAKVLGLNVADSEAQQAADTFRRRLGLLKADQTNSWLAKQRLSVDDFETGLRESLLLAKLRRHVSAKPAAERFAANTADFDKLVLCVVLVPTQDLAAEILSRIEEGSDLAELAREHSKHASAAKGGLMSAFRCQLSPIMRDALASTSIGQVVGPVATPDGFIVLRLEKLGKAALDKTTAAFLTRAAWQAWLREKLATAEFAAPLLDTLA
jgi:peptidylprolyl isomerase